MSSSLVEELGDRSRIDYLATLLAPADRRDALAAVVLYGHELAAVPLNVREPAAGEIRLQWWAEVVGGERDGEARGHPVASALRDAIEVNGLSRDALAEMAYARSRDLYADPMPDRETFEAYAGAVRSVPIQLACQVLDPDAAASSADAAGHAGVFAEATDRLDTLARDRARARSFLPSDLLLASWASPDDVLDPALATRDPHAGARIADVITAFADTHFSLFVEAAGDLPSTLAPAFASAHARTVRLEALKEDGVDVLAGVHPRWSDPVRVQRAVHRTAALFRRPERRSLFGRLRDGLRNRER